MRTIIAIKKACQQAKNKKILRSKPYLFWMDYTSTILKHEKRENICEHVVRDIDLQR